MLKLNQQTVRNWIDQGSLPALRVGRRVRIRRSDLERLLEQGANRRPALGRRRDRPERRGLLGWRAGRPRRPRARPSYEPRRGSRPSAGADHARRSPGGQRLGRGDACPQARAARPRVRRQARDRWRRQPRVSRSRGSTPTPPGCSGDRCPEQNARSRRTSCGRGPDGAAPRSCGLGSTLPSPRSTTRSPARARRNVADAFGELSEAAGALADAVAAEDAAPRTSKRFRAPAASPEPVTGGYARSRRAARSPPLDSPARARAQARGRDRRGLVRHRGRGAARARRAAHDAADADREQAHQLREDRENRVYLAGVELPRELRIEARGRRARARRLRVPRAFPRRSLRRGDRRARASAASRTGRP